MSIKLNNQTISGLYESQIIPQADTVNSGIIRIATQKEVDDGTDNTTAVTPFYLKQNVAENVKADGVTIVKNDDDSLTTIGQKSINNIIIVDWIGTKEEYELSWNDGTITPNTVCFITDDEEEANVEGLLFIPHSERVENGIIISWTNNQGYDNPDPVLIPFVENNVPLGGTTGQILAKKSDSDYILEWIDNDYSLSKNKPQINNIELIGNKTLDELNIQIKGDYATNTQLDEGLDTKANISDLSDVATSGNYNDLENKPLIPSKTSDLVNDSGFISGIPDEYVTEEELNSKGYITEIPDTVQLKLDNTLNTTSKTVVGGINELVNKKVDKEDSKSLISDTEIVRLSGVTNYDDTQIKEDINNLQSNSANIDLSNISQDGINKIKELSEGGSTAIVDVDGITIHNNSDNKLEIIGEKTKNNIAKYTWIGTKEEYNTDLTNGIITSDTECIITDDEENFIVEVDAYTRKEIDVKTENLLDKDLSSLSNIGQAKFDEKANKTNVLNKSQITNCITEIPQDIKLELNDGVLTLKAGSKVYMPNGVDVFDEIIIENDQHWNYGTGEFLILVNSNGVITGSKIEHIYSGTSSPTIVAGVVWYDTTNNIIKRSQTGTDWEEKNYALPISVVTTSSGSVTAIDQTFNGFGYIGSTIYVLPNVKGLIPNGRNEDGNLRNTEFTTNKVMTTTSPANSNAGFPLFFSISDENLFRLTTTSSFYDKNRNLNYDGDRQAYTSTCFAGTFLRNSSGQVISFNPKQTFNALDYSDYTNGVGSTKAYIVETYINGTSWYRVYSDGWCEQGGVSTGNGEQTVSLLKSYANTQYGVLICYLDSTSSSSLVIKNMSVWNKTVNSFKHQAISSGSASRQWQATGYIR